MLAISIIAITKMSIGLVKVILKGSGFGSCGSAVESLTPVSEVEVILSGSVYC